MVIFYCDATDCCKGHALVKQGVGYSPSLFIIPLLLIIVNYTSLPQAPSPTIQARLFLAHAPIANRGSKYSTFCPIGTKYGLYPLLVT